VRIFARSNAANFGGIASPGISGAICPHAMKRRVGGRQIYRRGWGMENTPPLRTGFGSEGAVDSRPLYGCVKFEAGAGVVKRHPRTLTLN